MYPFRSVDGDSPSEIQCQGHTLQSVPRKMDTEGKETQSTEPSHVAQSCVSSSRAEVLQIPTIPKSGRGAGSAERQLPILGHYLNAHSPSFIVFFINYA